MQGGGGVLLLLPSRAGASLADLVRACAKQAWRREFNVTPAVDLESFSG